MNRKKLNQINLEKRKYQTKATVIMQKPVLYLHTTDILYFLKNFLLLFMYVRSFFTTAAAAASFAV